MQLELITRNADLARILRNYADRRLHFALSRFGDRVERVTVTISEYADAQPSAGRSCHISVDLKPFGQVTAEEADPDVYAAIDRAASRVGRLLGSRLEKSQEMPCLVSGPESEKTKRKRQRARARTPFRLLRPLRAGRTFRKTGRRQPGMVVIRTKDAEIGRTRCKSN